MALLVTSASGPNGSGVGKILAFDTQGKLIGPFGNDGRITDPRGLAVEATEGLLFVNSGSDCILVLDNRGNVVRASDRLPGLNPGGANFGPDGRYYVGLRAVRTVMAFSKQLDSAGSHVLPPGIVPCPRGFAFGTDGTLFLASGIGPDGTGDDTILAFEPGGYVRSAWKVEDADVSPLDLAISPSGNVVVSSEKPFGHPNATTTIREYDAHDGHLLRVLSPSAGVHFRRPRGLRFGPDGRLYSVAKDEVVAFDFETGECVGAVVEFPDLNGQALVFFPAQ
jgi:hypothetical protein